MGERGLIRQLLFPALFPTKILRRADQTLEGTLLFGDLQHLEPRTRADLI